MFSSVRRKSSSVDEEVDDTNQAYEFALRKLKDSLRTELEMPPRKIAARDLKEHARKEGLIPNFDLPKSADLSDIPPRWTDLAIQTLFLPDTLKQYERNIERLYYILTAESI